MKLIKKHRKLYQNLEKHLIHSTLQEEDYKYKKGNLLTWIV
jgi:hypothetical protein